jgi:hypothetical protein
MSSQLTPAPADHFSKALVFCFQHQCKGIFFSGFSQSDLCSLSSVLFLVGFDGHFCDNQQVITSEMSATRARMRVLRLHLFYQLEKGLKAELVEFVAISLSFVHLVV